MDDKKQPRRPVAGSRSPAPAPRRIAGRPARPGVDAAPEHGVAEEPDSAVDPTAEDDLVTAPDVDEAVPERVEDAARPPKKTRSSILAKRSASTVLTLVVAVLSLALVAMLAFTAWQALRGDGATTSGKVLEFDEPYSVKDEPVTIPMGDWNAANSAAEKAVTEIFTFDWKNYDENVKDARALITPRFEEEYSATAEATRDKFIESKADYEVQVVGRSVVEATEDEVATLLFLNQFVYKGEGEKRTGPDLYQARMLVRMKRTDEGWLVDELRTD